MTADELKLLGTVFPKRPDLLAFWKNLQPGYDYFERFGVPPTMTVNGAGRYVISSQATPANPARPRTVSGSGR